MANGSFITREAAKAMVDRYTANTTTIVTSPYAFNYDYELIQELINQNDGATGVRVFLGLDENMEAKTILVATDADGNNLFNGSAPCLDTGAPCPDMCGDNPL